MPIHVRLHCLWTLTELCEHFGVEKHVLRYSVKAAGIEPTCRAGRCDLYGAEQLPEIERALEQTAVNFGNSQDRAD